MDLQGTLGTGNWGFGSFVSSWSRDGPGGLAAFAQFVTDFYAGDALHVATNLRRHGVRVNMNDAHYHGKLVNISASWWPGEEQRYMITDMELYDAFVAERNRTRYYCLGRMDPAFASSGRKPACFRGAGCTKWAAWYAMETEACWQEVPGTYTSRGLNMDMFDAAGAYVGCRGGWLNAEAQAHFAASFQGLGGDAGSPPTYGGVPVTAVHFNGGCKHLLCSAPMCAPLHRAAAQSPALEASLRAGAVGGCCMLPDGKQA